MNETIRGYYSLSPLYLGQVSLYKYQNEYGALGIFDGYKVTAKSGVIDHLYPEQIDHP